MSWSTAQVAKMSKVTSRTLRHYDAIGLLRPAQVGHNGTRYYDREQLLVLQRIMLLKELGLSLEAIDKIVNDGTDPVAQLRRHHRWLTEERDRYDRLAGTVAATIQELEGGEHMKPEELFENFDAAKQARYEAELVEKYGDTVTPTIAESKRKMAGWTKADADRIGREWAAFGPRLVALIEQGVPVDDARTFEVIADHHRWLTNFWTPNRDSYTGLGHTYSDTPEFRVQFDAQHPRLAEYLRDAMAAYARANL